MVEFGIMEVEGFGPINKATFNWGLPGLNIIQAPNGHGKTKFINALNWCLFGKTLSGSVETWDHIKPKDYKGTKVEVNFKIAGTPIRVIRCKEYIGKVEGAKGKNRLIVLENGTEIQTRDKKDIQKDLEILLGYSPDLFKNSIIFGQKLKRLINETGPNKKKVFDEAFEVTYIAKAKSLTEGEREVSLEAYNSQEKVVSGLLKDRDSKQTMLDREIEVQKNFETNKQANIKREQDAIDKDTLEAEELEQSLTVGKFAIIDGQIGRAKKKDAELKEKLRVFGDSNKIITQKVKLEMGISSDEKEIKKIEKEILTIKEKIKQVPQKCDRCGKPFTEVERRNEMAKLEREIKEKRLTITTITTTISTNKEVLSAVEQDASSILNTNNQIDILKDKLVALEAIKKDKAKTEEKAKDLREKIMLAEKSIEFFKGQVVENKIGPYTRDLSSISKSLLEEKGLLRQLHKALRIKDWLIEDPLSNKGLKAFIFNNMLDKVNEKLEIYSKYIGFQVVFDIDMQSHNKDLSTAVYTGDNIVPYDDLSGGQQQSVDVVSAFAIHDVVTEARECNLLIMDEIFESLDKNNIEIVTELIQDKAQTKSLYLVTHLDAFAPTYANIIKVDFNNGFTSLS